MRQFVILSCLLGFVTLSAQAQSFTQHLQQSQSGKAMTIKQSKEIDELVNNTDVSHDARQTATNSHADAAPKKAQQSSAVKQHDAAAPVKHPSATQEKAKAEPQASSETEGQDTPAVDMRKKVMRRSYKVNGYRVQVFAGGNSRTDKQKAERAGESVKLAFPDIPVYVHFYSPRWICRMGNFRTYEEANSVLKQVRDLGYKQACIVSGKITVAY